jgi:AAA domain
MRVIRSLMRLWRPIMPRLAKFDALAYAKEQLRARIVPTDPVQWVKDKTGVKLWSKQQEICYSVQKNRYTAVKSGHGVGKSFTTSNLATWWVDTHPADDTMVISTAPSSRQVGAIMWEEIRKIHRKANLAGEVQRANRWLIDNTEVGFGRKPQDYDKHAFQGLHRDNLLVIIDEACGVDEWLWVAAISMATGENNRIIAIGNPDDPSSYFAKVCRPGSDWNVIQISVFDSPNFTGEEVTDDARRKLTQQSWVDFMEKEIGRDTPTWTSKVLGEFPEIDEMSTIPLGWIHRAQERWGEWEDAGSPKDGRYLLGVDVARYGGDKTAFAHRWGDVVTSVEVLPGGDTERTADRVLEYSRATPIVDTNGVGAGVYDKLRSRGMSALPFNSGNRTSLRDSSGQIEFYNLRAAATWRLREALDPGKSPTLCLPPDELLAADLSAPRWKTMAGGKLVIETKSEVRKRLGRSPDRGDAVILASWLGGGRELGTEESTFDWVDNLDSVQDDDGDESGALDWVPASDEPSLEVNLAPLGRVDTSLEGLFR